MIILLFLIIFLSFILIFGVIFYYFFSVAFIKHNIGNTDNIFDPINKPLLKYRDIISEGIEYNKTEPQKWVNIKSFDGLNLYARYYDNKSDKTIILFHGYRSSALRDFSCAVRMYKDFGFNVLLCDQRSHGRSEGKLITFGVKEKKDVVSWCEFVCEKYSPEKIVLGGMSMGATTVLLSLGENLPENVKAAIVDCGFTSPEEIILKVAKQSFKINAKYVLPFLNIFCKFFGNFSIYNNDTRKTVANTEIPIMLIHGKEDGFVPCEMSVEAYNSAKSKKELLLVEGADHGLSFLIDSLLVKSTIKKFLKECDLY